MPPPGKGHRKIAGLKKKGSEKLQNNLAHDFMRLKLEILNFFFIDFVISLLTMF
jgi:hypothetical protein